MAAPLNRKVGLLQVASYLGLLAVVASLLWYALEGIPSNAERVPVDLSRDTLTVLRFRPHQNPPKAIIVFASGDGGWSNLEEAVSHALQNQGYEVLGIDSPSYAQTDYNLSVLQSDFDTIAQTALASYRSSPPPLIIGGYSMGAAQAIAAAGGPHPPQDMMGVLLMDPMTRGRYGLRSSDKVNVLPTGPGTFATNEFSSAMTNVRLVQWHAENDDIDSYAWLDSVTAPHQILTFPGTGHDYGKNRPEFLRQLCRSVAWILQSPPASSSSSTAAGGTGAGP